LVFAKNYRRATARLMKDFGTPCHKNQFATRRIINAPAALRPPQTTHKSRYVRATSNGSTAIRDKILASLASFGLANFPAPSGDYQPVRG